MARKRNKKAAPAVLYPVKRIAYSLAGFPVPEDARALEEFLKQSPALSEQDLIDLAAKGARLEKPAIMRQSEWIMGDVIMMDEKELYRQALNLVKVMAGAINQQFPNLRHGILILIQELVDANVQISAGFFPVEV